MYTQSLFFVLAGSAAATMSPRQLGRMQGLGAGLEARQDSADREACQESYSSIAVALPSPAGDLGEYLTSFYATADPTDPAALCQITSDMPESLSSAYASYDSAASSWIDEYVSVAGELASSCGGAAEAASVLGDLAESIASYTAEDCSGDFPTDVADLTSLIPIVGATPTGGDAPSETGSGNGGDNQGDSDNSGDSENSNDSDSPDESSAARPTGVIAGAMALAGVIGAIAML